MLFCIHIIQYHILCDIVLHLYITLRKFIAVFINVSRLRCRYRTRTSLITHDVLYDILIRNIISYTFPFHGIDISSERINRDDQNREGSYALRAVAISLHKYTYIRYLSEYFPGYELKTRLLFIGNCLSEIFKLHFENKCCDSSFIKLSRRNFDPRKTNNTILNNHRSKKDSV